MSESSPTETSPQPRSRRAALRAIGAGVAGLIVGGGSGLVAGRATEREGLAEGIGISPKSVQLGGHALYWSVDTDRPVVALTFDDGPDPRYTPGVLEALARAGVRATFFMMGYNAEQHQDLARRVVAEGHEVGNHTWSHLDLACEGPDSAMEEIRRGRDAIRDVTGVETVYFRPPRGEITGSAMRILASMGFATFLWSVSRQREAPGTPDEIAEHVVGRLAPGAIVVMHDSVGRGVFAPDKAYTRKLEAKRAVDVEAVSKIIAAGRSAGYEFVTVTELLLAAKDPAGIRPPGTAHA